MKELRSLSRVWGCATNWWRLLLNCNGNLLPLFKPKWFLMLSKVLCTYSVSFSVYKRIPNSNFALCVLILSLLIVLGKDLIALSQTGSGKTGAFSLPILQAYIDSPQFFMALVLSPTRLDTCNKGKLWSWFFFCLVSFIEQLRTDLLELQGACTSDWSAVPSSRVWDWRQVCSGEHLVFIVAHSGFL